MKVKEHFHIGHGIFKALQKLDVPWKTDETPDISNNLDIIWLSRSGDRTLSPLFHLLYNELIPVDDINDMIAEALFTMFEHKWKKQYAVLSLEYDPISNYDSYEKYTPHGEIHNDSNGGATDDIKTYGYNSADETDKDKNVNTHDDHNTESYKDYFTETTKRGNIGVTTSQQMALSELELWRWKFFEEVMNDINSYLTIPIY